MTELLTAQQLIEFLEYEDMELLIGPYGEWTYDDETHEFISENSDERYSLDEDEWDGFAIHKCWILGWEKGWLSDNHPPTDFNEDFEDATLCLIKLTRENKLEQWYRLHKEMKDKK